MDETDQVERFCNEIDKVIVHFADEFDMSYAAMIGALNMKMFELLNDAYFGEDDEPDDGDDGEGEEWKQTA